MMSPIAAPQPQISMNDVQEGLTVARTEARRLATRVSDSAQAHPLASAAVLVVSGMALGALAYRLLVPRPTARQLLVRALRDGASLAGARRLVG